MNNYENKIFKNREREREREREQFWWLTNNRDKLPISEAPQRDDNQGGDGGNNNPKCSKCGVNDACLENLTIAIKDTKEKKVIWDKPLCQPCWDELVKCQVCKNEEAKRITKDGLNDVWVCDKCYYCSKCKINKAIAQFVGDKEGKIFYQGSICEACIRELPEFKCEICKLKSAVKPDGNIRYKEKDQKKINVCESCFQKQENPNKGNYVRKVARVNAPDNDAVKKRMAELTKKCEKGTMTCCFCHKEFTYGFINWTETMIYCEECGRDRTDNEFKAWIEEIKKEPAREQPRTNPGQPAPQKPSVSRPKKSSQGYAVCSKCNSQNLDGYVTGSRDWEKLCNKCYKATCFKDKGYVTLYFYSWDKKFNSYLPVFEINGPCLVDCKHSQPNSSTVNSNSPQSSSPPSSSKPNLTNWKPINSSNTGNLTLTTLKQIKIFLMVNGINSITKQPSGNLLLTFNKPNKPNSTSPSQPTTSGLSNKTIVITNEQISDETNSTMDIEQRKMWKNFKDYLEKEGKNSLNKNELDQVIKQLEANELAGTSQIQTPKKTNWPLIVGVSLIAIGGVIGGLIYYFWNKKTPK